MSVDQLGAKFTVEDELSMLGWVLAERFYREWRSVNRPGYPLWADLGDVLQESLAQAFTAMLSSDSIQVGSGL